MSSYSMEPCTCASHSPSRTSSLFFQKAPDLMDLTLVQVQVVFRHGARTPLYRQDDLPEVEYPRSLMRRLRCTDFNYKVQNLTTGETVAETSEQDRKHILKGGCLSGTLTTVGQQSMYDLGVSLKNEYMEQLGITSFSNNDIYIRSTNIHRTIISLCCVLSGFFGVEHLHSVEPISIPVKDGIDEDMYPNNIMICPALWKRYQHIIGELETFQRNHEDLNQIRLILGDSPNLSFLSIYDHLASRLAHGYDYPPHLLPFRESIDRNCAIIMHAITTCKIGKDYPDMTPLSIGTFLHTLLGEMDKAVAGSAHPKLYLYSAHDSTLTALSHALGTWRNKWIPFASCIRLELYKHKNHNKFFVRTKFRGEVVRIRDANQDIVPLSQFRSILAPFVKTPKERAKLCYSNTRYNAFLSSLHAIFCCFCCRPSQTNGNI